MYVLLLSLTVNCLDGKPNKTQGRFDFAFDVGEMGRQEEGEMSVKVEYSQEEDCAYKLWYIIECDSCNIS